MRYNDVSVVLQGKSFWKKYEVEKIIKVWLKNLSKANWNNLKKRAVNSFNEYFQTDKNRFTTYDPRNGKFEFELYVPYDLKDLPKLPMLNAKYYIERVKDVIADLTPSEDWNVWDTLYKYKPSMNPRDWVPPFTGNEKQMQPLDFI